MTRVTRSHKYHGRAQSVVPERAPIHVIAWRLLWWIPMLVTKSFFLGVVAIGWGPKVALSINRAL